MIEKCFDLLRHGTGTFLQMQIRNRTCTDSARRKRILMILNTSEIVIISSHLLHVKTLMCSSSYTCNKCKVSYELSRIIRKWAPCASISILICKSLINPFVTSYYSAVYLTSSISTNWFFGNVAYVQTRAQLEFKIRPRKNQVFSCFQRTIIPQMHVIWD